MRRVIFLRTALFLAALLAARAQDNDADCKFDTDNNPNTENVFSGALELTKECKCGNSNENNCGMDNKKYCWPKSLFKPNDPEMLCREAPMCRTNVINKQPGGYVRAFLRRILSRNSRRACILALVGWAASSIHFCV